MKKRILVVDDEIGIRIILKEILEDEGYQVEVAASGRLALAQIRVHDFDLVVSDVMMPEMNGLQLVSELRAGNSKVKIIMMTSTHNKEVRFLFEQGKINYYLDKPFAMSEFVSLVRRVL